MTRKIRFIGDIHGNFEAFLKITEEQLETIQVGDFGFGFGPYNTAEYLDTHLFPMREGMHRFIRGNHDSPSECAKSKNYITDGYIDDNMMFVGGALSIDRLFRTENVDWWADEELSVERLNELVDLYEEKTPSIMITHDCPEMFAHDVMIPLVNGYSNFPSRTRNALDSMFDIHKPKIWIFGHWHRGIVQKYRETTFICLPEFGYVDIDVELYE